MQSSRTLETVLGKFCVGDEHCQRRCCCSLTFCQYNTGLCCAMEMAETGTINLEIEAVATHTCSSVGPETEALRPAEAWSA